MKKMQKALLDTGGVVLVSLIGGLFFGSPALSAESAAQQMGLRDSDRVIVWRADSPENLDLVTINSIPAGGKSLEFVSMPSCRLFDTRLAGGPFGGGAFREYSILNANLPAQGGSVSGCNYPSGADALVISISTVNNSPTVDGYLRVGPAGATPTATVLAFETGQGVSVTTNTGLSLSSAMRIQIFGGSTNIVGDAVGYYRKTLHATVNSNFTLTRGSGVVSVEQYSTNVGYYIITFDRDISECTPVANPQMLTTDARVKSILNGPLGEVFVLVEAYDSTTDVNATFNLTVSC